MAKMIFIYAAVALAFLAIYFIANWYIYLKLEKLFRFNKIALAAVLFVLAVSFILLSFLVRKFQGNWINDFYFSSASWLGVLFFLLICFLIADLVVFAAGIDYKIPYYAAIGVALAISILSLANASQIKVHEINLPTSLSSDLKIVQISDVHLGPIHSKSYLQKIVDITNSLKPDFVFITGDLFDGSAKLSKDVVSPLEQLKAKQGIYFVTGNHESYIDESMALDLISSENISILRDMAKETKDVQIIGADYPLNESEKGKSYLNNLPSIVNKNKFSILLYHPPVGFEKAAAAGINLQLSGHTHNGQIFPFSLISRIFYKYESGLYKLKDSYLYVSQGSGTWGPPMRFLSSTEITEINLMGK